MVVAFTPVHPMLGALLYHLGSYFARVLPGRVPRRIAWMIGMVNWVLRLKTRRVVAHNLRLAAGGDIPPRELRRRVRRTVLNFAECIEIFLELPSMEWEDLERRCDLSEFHRAVEVLGGSRAFVVAAAHVGPWELGGYCLSRLGYPLHTVALDHPSRHVTRFFSRRRARLGIQAYPLKDSFHKLEDALERGECVGLLVDRAYGNARLPATLFGVEKDFPLGHAILAVRKQVPVLVGGLVLDGDGFRYVHGGTHFPDPALEVDERIARIQRACLADLEGIIRAHSDQWFHFRRLEANTKTRAKPRRSGG